MDRGRRPAFRGSARQALWVLLAASWLPCGTFAAPLVFGARTLPTGVCPATIVSVDLNGDGKDDLLVANHHSHEIGIFLKSGPGAFDPQPAVPVPGQHVSHALSLAVGDFDEDGQADVATSSFSNNEAIVFHGDGKGSLVAPRQFPVGRYSLRVVTADFDEDDHLDLAVCDGDDDSVTVLFGDGKGAFGRRLDLGVGNAPSAVTIVDLNHDGHIDIVTPDSQSNGVSLLFGDGTGKFAEAKTLDGFGVTKFVVATDFDSDGNVDLSVTHSDGISVLLGDGAGGFGASLDDASDKVAVNAAAADWNEDGIVDLAAADWETDQVSFFAGNGDGRLAPPQRIAVGDAPWGVLPVDLDDDGHMDLVVSNEHASSITLLRSRGFDRSSFRRGDANADGRLDISDGVHILTYLFLGGVDPGCRSALDANDDETLGLTDAVYILLYLFNGGKAPPAPFASCGMDPTDGGPECSAPTGACAGA